MKRPSMGPPRNHASTADIPPSCRSNSFGGDGAWVASDWWPAWLARRARVQTLPPRQMTSRGFGFCGCKIAFPGVGRGSRRRRPRWASRRGSASGWCDTAEVQQTQRRKRRSFPTPVEHHTRPAHRPRPSFGTALTTLSLSGRIATGVPAARWPTLVSTSPGVRGTSSEAADPMVSSWLRSSLRAVVGIDLLREC